MNTKSLAVCVSFLLCLPLLFAFIKKDKPQKKLPKVFREHYKYVPNLSYTLQPEFEQLEKKWESETKSKTVSTKHFYCSQTEVSNLQYREFLESLKSQGRSEDFQVAQIDSLMWQEKLQYNEPYVEYYHNHPAYNDYPVVNISHEGAKLYCNWLEGVLNASSEDGLEYKVTLPTRNQWIAAAKGGYELSPYPWGGPFVRNVSGKLLANFMYVGAENVRKNKESGELEVCTNNGIVSFMGVAGQLNDNPDITAPVTSYNPNNFGLYNMSGNVAEMVQEEGIACGGGWRSPGADIRCVSTMEYDGPQTDIGFRPIIEILVK